MKKTQATKNQIIETTKRLVKTSSHVTVKDICEASFVNIAAINYHFGDKSNLMKIVISQIVEEIQIELMQYLQEDKFKSAEEWLSKVMELIFRFATENKGLIHYLFVASENDGDVSYYGIVQNFLFNNPFASVVLSKLNMDNQTDTKILYSRFLILFSSLSMPMIMEFATNKKEYREFSIDNPDFKTKYIQELLKILK